LKKNNIVSVANLPDDLAIKDPFDKDWLMSLPKEVLVEVIIRAHKEFVLQQAIEMNAKCERFHEVEAFSGNNFCPNCGEDLRTTK
jgi:hypothetical protein